MTPALAIKILDVGESATLPRTSYMTALSCRAARLQDSLGVVGRGNLLSIGACFESACEKRKCDGICYRIVFKNNATPTGRFRIWFLNPRPPFSPSQYIGDGYKVKKACLWEICLFPHNFRFPPKTVGFRKSFVAEVYVGAMEFKIRCDSFQKRSAIQRNRAKLMERDTHANCRHATVPQSK